MLISILLKSGTTDKLVIQCLDMTLILKKIRGNKKSIIIITTQNILMKVLMATKMTCTLKLPPAVL